MGNKGAVVVHLSLYDSTLCFVCAHMAAKRANIQGRNSDFWSILAKTGFAGDPETAWCVVAWPSPKSDVWHWCHEVGSTWVLLQ